MRGPPPYSCHFLLRARRDSAEAAGASWPASRTVLEGTAHLRTHCACFAKAALITAVLLPSSRPISDKGWLASLLQGTITALLVLHSLHMVKYKHKKSKK